MGRIVARVARRYATGDLSVATTAIDPDFNILEFPDTRQATGFTCGASSVQSIMYYYGQNIREDNLAEALGSDPDAGTAIADVEQFFKSQGLRVNSGIMTVADLRRNVDMGIPTMLPIQAWPDDPKKNLADSWDDGHWVVVIGYAPGTIIFDDPVLLDNHGYMAVDVLNKRWHDKDDNGKLEHFGIAVWGKEPQFKDHTMIRIEACRVATRHQARLSQTTRKTGLG